MRNKVQDVINRSVEDVDQFEMRDMRTNNGLVEKPNMQGPSLCKVQFRSW